VLHRATHAIPGTRNAERARSNSAAGDVELDANTIAALDDLFPPGVAGPQAGEDYMAAVQQDPASA
jgi:aryl-alcohol dehydrogenase-like predicted oxidoreductase